MVRTLVNASDNDVGTFVQAKSTCVHHHIIVSCIGPTTSCILVVVVVAPGVNLLYALGGGISIKSVLFHHTSYGIIAVRSHEHAEGLLVIAQHPVGTTTDDDAWFLNPSLTL